MGEIGGALLVGLVVLGLFIAVLWVLLPFAVFGVKDVVREAVAQQRRTNELLEQLLREKGPPRA